MKCMMFNKIDFFNVNSSQLFGMHFQSRTLNSQKQNDKILCDEVEKPDGTNLHSLISHHISKHCMPTNRQAKCKMTGEHSTSFNANCSFNAMGSIYFCSEHLASAASQFL